MDRYPLDYHQRIPDKDPMFPNPEYLEPAGSRDKKYVQLTGIHLPVFHLKNKGGKNSQTENIIAGILLVDPSSYVQL